MSDDLRELLFGDASSSTWGGPTTESDLRAALHDPRTETRQRLQALHALRGLGVDTASLRGGEPDHLYGVVIDMPINSGLDTLAAYEDGSARYLNHAGPIVVWDSQAPDIDTLVMNVLNTGRPLLQLAGRWDGDRPALGPNLLRVSLLCGDGLHFGQGPTDILASDSRVSPLIAAGLELMQALMARSK